MCVSWMGIGLLDDHGQEVQHVPFKSFNIHVGHLELMRVWGCVRLVFSADASGAPNTSDLSEALLSSVRLGLQSRISLRYSYVRKPRSSSAILIANSKTSLLLDTRLNYVLGGVVVVVVAVVVQGVE